MIADQLFAVLGFEYRGADDLKRFQNGMKQAEQNAQSFIGSIGKMGAALGAALGGIAIGSGLADLFSDSTKQAIAFEDQLSAIQKKAGATTEQMAKVKEEVLALASSGEVAATIEELSSAFARGAANGIPLEDLKKFALLSAKTADAFEMTPEAVANAFAGFEKVLGVPREGLERIADLINAVGDAGIADEIDIVSFMDKAGAMMKTAGFTVEDIAAIGGALANLKVPADVAATAMNSVMTNLLSPQTISKEGRAAFAGLVGNTKAFAKSLQEDAGGAVEGLLEKLKAMDESSRAAAIVDIFGKESLRTVVAMVEGLDEVRANRALAANEGAWLGSLEKAYDLKLATVSSQLKIFGERLRILKIRFGDAILPVMAKSIKRLGQFFQQLDRNGTVAEFGKNFARGLDRALDVAAQLAIQAYRIGRGFYNAAGGVVDLTSRITGLSKEMAAIGLGAGALGMTKMGRTAILGLARRTPLVAAALMFEDILSGLNGDESYVGSLDGGQEALAQINAELAAMATSSQTLADALNGIFGIQVKEGQTPLDALKTAAEGFMETEIVAFLREISQLVKEVGGAIDKMTGQTEYYKAVQRGREKQGKNWFARQGLFQSEDETHQSAIAGGWEGPAPDGFGSPIRVLKPDMGPHLPAEQEKRDRRQARPAPSPFAGVAEPLPGMSMEQIQRAAKMLDNAMKHIRVMSPGEIIQSMGSITATDARNQSVTNHITSTVHQTVQQASQAPMAAAQATSAAVRQAAMPPARIAGGNTSR